MFANCIETILVRRVSIENGMNERLAENIFGNSEPLQITPERLSRAIAGMVKELIAGDGAMAADDLRDEKSVRGRKLNAQNTPGSDSVGRQLAIRSIDGGELRRTPRYPLRLPSRIHTRERTAEATVVDVSRDGLGVEVGLALEVGERVAVENESCMVLATVRYCREAREGHFRAGLEIYHVVCNAETSGADRGVLGAIFADRIE